MQNVVKLYNVGRDVGCREGSRVERIKRIKKNCRKIKNRAVSLELRNTYAVVYVTGHVKCECGVSALTGVVSAVPRCSCDTHSGLLFLCHASEARAPFLSGSICAIRARSPSRPREPIDWLWHRRRKSFRLPVAVCAHAPVLPHCCLHPSDFQPKQSMDPSVFRRFNEAKTLQLFVSHWLSDVF